MTNVYWLEQVQADVPEADDWLSATEVARLNGMRFAKRRADWRLGRWTAKQALAICLNVPFHSQALTNIEIRPAPCGAPEVFLVNKPADATISLSHRAGRAVCAVALSGPALGCDLEVIEPRSDTFEEDYFASDEQALAARVSTAARPGLLTLLWSGKESALKALRTGLRLDTRSVIVSLVDEQLGRDLGSTCRSSSGLDTWHPLQVRQTSGQIFQGWWNHTENLLRTVVATPPPTPPVVLKIRTPLQRRTTPTHPCKTGAEQGTFVVLSDSPLCVPERTEATTCSGGLTSSASAQILIPKHIEALRSIDVGARSRGASGFFRLTEPSVNDPDPVARRSFMWLGITTPPTPPPRG